MSYFGGARKGKVVCAAGEKMPVFSILKRGDKVYVEMIENAKSAAFLPIIRMK